MGEYLLNAQGEDVVAGIRNADPIEKLKTQMPEAYNQFMDITAKLEKHYKDMQDVEFTIERPQVVDASNPRRKTDGQVCGEDRGGYGERRTYLQGRSSKARYA